MPELTRRYIVMTMATEAPFDMQDPEAPFVLKPWKDPAALRALEAYRDHAYPELAADLGPDAFRYFVLREYTVGVEAVAVVELALQRVAEDFVSFRNALEVLLCGGITRIDIRMIPASQLSKGFLDVVFGSRTDDFQDNIQIIKTAHETPLSGGFAQKVDR